MQVGIHRLHMHILRRSCKYDLVDLDLEGNNLQFLVSRRDMFPSLD